MEKESKNGWIFSGPTDFLIFIGVALISIMLVHVADGRFLDLHTLFIWYLMIECLDRGHCLSAIYPTFFFVKKQQLSWVYCFLGLFAIVVLGLILFHWVHRPYMGILGLLFIWHATRQNVGWVHISSSRSGEKRSFIDDLMVYNACGLPFLYYLANPEVSPKLYYIDLSFVAMPGSLADVFLMLFWGYSIFYLLYQTYLFSKHQWNVNFAKYVIILSSLLCIAVPYIMFPQEQFLIVPMIFVHTVSYVLFTYYFSKEKNRQSPYVVSRRWKAPLKSPIFYIILFLTLGWVYAELCRPDNWWGQNIMLPISYSIGIVVHSIIDAYIWKRRFSSEFSNWTYSDDGSLQEKPVLSRSHSHATS